MKRERSKTTRGAKRDLFAELSEGMEALAEGRKGKRILRTHAVEYKPAPTVTPSIFEPTVPEGPNIYRKLLSVMKSPLDGLGCFATVRFLKNNPIAEYAGERITRKEAMRRMRRPGGRRITELEADCYIDGSVDGNDTQYINHSCEPNADAFIVDGFLIVFALQEIMPGEEITIDYLNSFEDDRTACQCRAASCRYASACLARNSRLRGR